MRRLVRLSVSAAMALLLGGLAPPAVADDLEKKVDNARQVLAELLDAPDKKVPKKLLNEAVCVGVAPQIVKGAIGWGGRHGRGVLSCRRNGGGWSAPVFFHVSGGSVGFQIGVEVSDLVLFFMTERGVRSLLDSKFILGGDASVAAGPFGRSAEASTDLKLKAEIYVYAKARGLFAGVSVEGARLAATTKDLRRYYGERLWPEDVLFGASRPSQPPAARRFVAALP